MERWVELHVTQITGVLRGDKRTNASNEMESDDWWEKICMKWHGAAFRKGGNAYVFSSWIGHSPSNI